MSKLCERLKELMICNEISPKALATKTNLAKNSITRYLQGVTLPGFESFVSIIDYFNCSADFMLGLVEFPDENQKFLSTPPFKEQFRVAMRKCNLSQYAVQKRTKLSWANFDKWLNGKALPSLENLEKLAKAMGCSVDFLIGRVK